MNGTQVYLSEKDLNTLIEAASLYLVKQGNKIKSVEEYEEKRSTLDEYKYLIHRLKGERLMCGKKF